METNHHLWQEFIQKSPMWKFFELERRLNAIKQNKKPDIALEREFRGDPLTPTQVATILIVTFI